MTKISNESARILIATHRRDNAELILRHLQDEFADVRASTDPARAADDFETCEPDVVVLAFDDLAGAQDYYRRLHARLRPLKEHRSVILCSRAECARVVEHCKDEEFDDYVLYWPQPYDGFRLATSIRIACREMASVRAHRRVPPHLFGHARHVDRLDRIIDVELDDADSRAGEIRQSLATMEHEVGRVVDAFSDKLNADAAADWIDIKDRDMLADELLDLKKRQLETVGRFGAIEIAAMRARARHLKDRLEPSLAGVRSLVEELRKLRPVVLIVEDDEFSRELVARMLDPEHWETVFASDGKSAMHQLEQARPDVILMDIRMPGVDGLSLTQQLKASHHLADIPVIMMTGDARKETLVSSLAAGAVDFVVKPFTRLVLSEKLERSLSR